MAERWQQWMPFHIDRWRGSPSVQAMHPAAQMGYLNLLCSCWQSADCCVPSDPVDLATESRLGDELWVMYGPRILRKFVDVSGRWRNDVLFVEWDEARRVYEKRKSGAVRTNTSRSANGERTQSSRNTDTQTLTGTETSTGTKEQSTLALTSVEVPAGRGKLLGTILLNKGEYEVRADDLARDGPLYPGVDVLAEYRAMKAWSIANPTQRKTPKGIARFMNNWLAKAQNNGGKNVGTQQSQRIDPNSDRFARSIEAIGGAAARRYGGRTGADDGAGKGPVSQPDDARSDGGHVPGGVGRDGAEVRPGDVPGRVIEGVA